MIEPILKGVVSTILLTATAMPQFVDPHSQLASLQVPDIVSANQKVWTVQPGDSLKYIAQKVYGSEDFWTTVWMDNDWIENSEVIQAGWQITLRSEKPEYPEALKDELVARIPTPTPVESEPTADTNFSPPSESAPSEQADSLPASPTPQSSATPAPQITNPGGPLTDAQLTFLGNCEAGMDPTRNSGNGYYGAFQFSYGTWARMNTGYERADLAPLAVQEAAVEQLLSRSSIYTQFPACAQKMAASGLL